MCILYLLKFTLWAACKWTQLAQLGCKVMKKFDTLFGF
jgi:hypothetical protein